MDPTARLKSWTPRILFLSVLAILLLVGIIQYQWFSRSAAVEIEATIKGLEASVRQTALREYQRYAPVISEIQSLGAGGTPARKLVLDRLLNSYGPSGITPDLLAWVGWAEAGTKTWSLGTGESWTVKPLEGEPWARILGPEGAPVQGNLMVTTVNGNGLQTLFIQSTDKKDLILLGVDPQKFWGEYVEPSLKEAFPGAAVGLMKSNGEEGFGPPREGFDARNYSFNPLRALIAGPSIPQEIVVAIPRLYDPGRSNRGRTSPPDLLQAVSPLPGFNQIVVTLPPDAPVLTIERRLAWNWFGGTLLLVVLGGAFGLVLRQSARVAEQRRREKEFVASVSHELRTPLTVIRSAADNFAQGIVAPERQARYGQLILDQSLRLGRMIEEMLSFAQAEASSSQARVQAPLVFETWLAELQPPLEALAAARQVHLVWDVAGVPVSGLTDPEALRLVLENLVVNAINHAYPPPGSPDPRPVRISLRHLVPDRLELVVDDDGRGISPQEAKKVFDPFYRDQVSRDQQEKGSGLGLFLARHQVRRLGGDLKLETPWRRLDGSRRHGCRFVAVIPFQVEEASHGR